MELWKDGRCWRAGRAGEVAWITEHTRNVHTITAAIPPVFADYATVHPPNFALDPPDRETADKSGEYVAAHERSLLAHLTAETPYQAWWLGYLETGAHDVVFPEAPRVNLYEPGWKYVLVEAGPEQAATWRSGHMRSSCGVLPDLMFPHDRTWLFSALWDDTWACLGGPERLIQSCLYDPLTQARRVRLDDDVIPPGHEDFRTQY